MQEKRFTERVYEIVKKIPKGRVSTYGQIAALLGKPKAYRAVGNALHNNPTVKIIPCHRVVNASGKLAKAFKFGGIEAKKAFLEEENVVVDENYSVDLEKFGWHGNII